MAKSTTKEEKYNYQVINIKLQTSKTGEAKQNAYTKLLKDLVLYKIHTAVAKDKHMIVYSCHDAQTERGVSYHYGNIGRGIFFEEDAINNLTIGQSETQTVQTDKVTIMKTEVARYVYVPSIHRLAIILKGTSINANHLYKFFSKTLNQVADNEDIVEVEIVKDPSITHEILSSYALHRVKYTVSYTNDDPNAPITTSFDDRLKRMGIGKGTFDLAADHNGAINKDEPEELLHGGINLAEQNGIIHEAVITPQEGDRKKKLKNNTQPRIFKIFGNIATYTALIVNNLIDNFPRN